jgi:hypothetical protein
MGSGPMILRPACAEGEAEAALHAGRPGSLVRLRRGGLRVPGQPHTHGGLARASAEAVAHQGRSSSGEEVAVSFVRGRHQETEASRIYDALIEPRPIDGGWSSICPRHRGSLLWVTVAEGRLGSVYCSGSDDCAVVARLSEVARG